MKTYRAHAVGSLTTNALFEQNPVVPAGHIVMPSDNPEIFRVGDGVTRHRQLTDYSVSTFPADD